MKHITRLKNLHDGAVFMIGGLQTIHRLMQISFNRQSLAQLSDLFIRQFAIEPEVLYMDEPFGSLDALTRLQMRIELLPKRIDTLNSKLGQVIDELPVDQLEPPAINLVLFLAVRRQRMLEPIDHRYQPLDHARRRTPGIFRAFLLDALAIILEIGLPPQQCLPQIVKFAEKFRGLWITARRIRLYVSIFHGWLQAATAFIAFHIDILVRHFPTSSLPKVSQILLNVSLNSCAT